MLARDEGVAELLQERQAKGLRIPAAARIAFALFGLLSALAPAIPRQTFVLIAVACLCTLAANVLFIVMLNRRRRVELIGWLGVAFDVSTVVIYPILMAMALAEHGQSWVNLFRHPYTLVCIVLVVINAQSLQPRYPAVVAAAAVVVHLVLALATRSDPNVIWAGSEAQLLAGGMSGDFIASRVIFLFLVSLGVIAATSAARKTVVEAVQRQAERARLVREHAASVMEGRLDALRNLVASLSHEMNSPLGAIKSAAETLSNAATRLQQAHTEGSTEQTSRLARVIRDAAPIPAEAADRLDGMLRQMSVFTQLDAAELASIDVNEALERTVALIPAAVRGDSVVARDLTATARVSVPAARLNLALMTIVTNAFEANGGKGEVSLRSADHDDAVVVEIDDSGPGLSEQQAERLFEVRINEEAGSRVKAGLGLPAAYNLIKQHGGAITVRASKTGGACFVISLLRANAQPARG